MKTKQILCSALVALTAFGAISCSSSKENKEIGLQLYSIGANIDKDLNGSLDSVAIVGYTVVEAAGYDGEGKFYGQTPEAFKALLDSKGLQFISSHTGTTAPDSAGWDATMAWWDQTIAAHKAAGVKYIVQPWMGADAFSDLDALKR